MIVIKMAMIVIDDDEDEDDDDGDDDYDYDDDDDDDILLSTFSCGIHVPTKIPVQPRFISSFEPNLNVSLHLMLEHSLDQISLS